MKYGLLAVSIGCEGGINIGDYIQALASKQFLPHVDLFLEREMELKSYEGDKVKIIMNGWYMNHPENWPPSDEIDPLFVAFHINRCGLPGLLKDESIAYFKKHEPIGCRDTNTQKRLREKGVKAFFSGCMTLTLGYKYHSKNKSGKVYIVEPYTCKTGLYSEHKIELFKTIIYLAIHFKDVKNITQKKDEHGYRSIFYNAYFLKEYSKVFDYKMLVDAEYVNQYNEKINEDYPTQNDKLNYAERLIKNYAQASCVITSRIHCGLPCLGLGTPVIFVEDAAANDFSTSRFGGLINLFNTMIWDGLHLRNNKTKDIINKENFPKNKDEWKTIAYKLIKTCREFINT